ncbi:MAG TPA: glycosyltransferase family 2 protein [Chryseosolibacter sp.]|nr:glycosyltransferase family 2 protein [Chryseosolibacter sp.]
MNTDRPLISVVLCFYNEEKFLAESVQSVFGQDYENWELLLVDDGSSDKSTMMALSFADEFPEKVFYLDHAGHANRGLSASRNLGIANAQGSVVAFIDADDVWLPQKLSYQLGIFRKFPNVAVILEASEYWRSWVNPDQHDIVIPVGAREGVYFPPELMLTLYPLAKGAAPCPSGIMIKKSSLKRSYFEESFRGMYQMYEDQAFLCKVYLNETVFVSGESHNRYRQRPSSLVSSVHHDGNYHNVRRYYLDWFSDYLSTVPVQHKNVRRLLDKARAPYNQPVIHRLTVALPRFIKGLVARVFVKLGLLTYHKTW